MGDTHITTHLHSIAFPKWMRYITNTIKFALKKLWIPHSGKNRYNMESPSESDQWNFEFDVRYVFTIIPDCAPNKSAIGQAFAFIKDNNGEDTVTIQEDQINFPSIPDDRQIPKVDAIIGNFDLDRPTEELVLYRVNDIIKLVEIDFSSIKKYKELYSEACETDFFTKSQVCEIDRTEKIVTVYLNSTQIKLAVYYFNNRKKIIWGESPIYDHGISFDHIIGFDISVDKDLRENTVEVIAVVSKFSYPFHTPEREWQTNIIKLLIDISSKKFSFICSQKLVECKGFGGLIFFKNMVQQVYQLKRFVYLNYLSNFNTFTIAALQWNDINCQYQQIWHEDYFISEPNFLHSNGNNFFYKHSDKFYFGHIYEAGNKPWPSYVEIYQQETNGFLRKNESISFDNSDLDRYFNYWSGIYIQDSLYLMETTVRTDRSCCKVFYKVDDDNKKVILLSIIDSPLLTVNGSPIMVLSSQNIKAQAPTIKTIEECSQVVAVLDAPPMSSLINYSDRENYPTLTYLFQKEQSSTQNIETSTERVQSDNLQAGLQLFGSSIGDQISKQITDTTQNSYQKSFRLIQNTRIDTKEQDMVIILGMAFNIYEYPIGINEKIVGYFLFIVPNSELHLIITTGRLMFRKTSHQIYNLLSYPMSEPSDIKQLLYSAEFSINDSENEDIIVTYIDMKTISDSTTTTTTVRDSVSLNIEFPIIKHIAANISASIQDDYTKSDIKISSFTIENSFELSINIPKLTTQDANKYFSIQPYFYIDKSNIVRCTYRVDVPSGGTTTPTYWKDHYEYPDFGMVMPFHQEEFKEDSKYLLSFDIKTDPSEFQGYLKELNIFVTVHNWSLVSGENVEVAFYYMKEFKRNPSKEELIEIGRKTTGLIEPRQSKDVNIKWENPYIIDVFNAVPIYVIIDPDNKIKQMSEDNKFAQMNYPITSVCEYADDSIKALFQTR